MGLFPAICRAPLRSMATAGLAVRGRRVRPGNRDGRLQTLLKRTETASAWALVRQE